MLEALLEFIKSTGYYALFSNGLDIGRIVMIAISCVLLYLAIKKGFEPLLLVPIAFGMLLTNLPLGDMMIKPVLQFLDGKETTLPLMNQINVVSQGTEAGHIYTALEAPGGLFYYLYLGVKLGIFPPLIFMGVGAMTDFGPLIANPRSLLLGAAAQFGIFFTFIGALLLGFTGQEAGAIGIIGGADGPTAIFVASKLAPHLLGAIAVAAYSYMALVPVIQPPIMKALTTKKERMIKMEQLRHVSKTEKIIFPIAVTIIVSMLVPAATALVGMLMLGNLFRECGVTARLEDTAKNALINIVTIFLGVTVGATATAESFLSPSTLKIIALGVTAFAVGTATGVLLA
ncbi:MAG: glutaconyl-CoA decarboxylase subunit beta, partial [Clostridiales bacterium]